jgi:hypothetical protein
MNESWTCNRCGVTARFGTGSEQPALPDGWAHTDGEWHCLACRRIAVIEAAGPRHGTGAGSARRLALTEFELLRDPSAPDRVIARRVKCSTSAVVPVRAELRAQGRLRPAQ